MIALWGLMMASGKSSAPVRDMFMLGIKVGAANLAHRIYLPNNFARRIFWNIAGLLYDYMMRVVSTYVLNLNLTSNAFSGNAACTIPAS